MTFNWPNSTKIPIHFLAYQTKHKHSMQQLFKKKKKKKTQYLKKIKMQKKIK